MLVRLLKTGWPLAHELGLALALAGLLLEEIAHYANTLLVVDQSSLRFDLLEETCDFKVGVVVEGVQLAHVPEELESLILILWSTRLPSLDLGQEPDSFIAIFVPRAGQHGVQVLLGRLEISHMEVHLGLAEECLVVPGIELDALLVALEGFLVALLRVLDLAKDEVESGSKVVHVLPISWYVPMLMPCLILQD